MNVINLFGITKTRQTFFLRDMESKPKVWKLLVKIPHFINHNLFLYHSVIAVAIYTIFGDTMVTHSYAWSLMYFTYSVPTALYYMMEQPVQFILILVSTMTSYS